MVSIVVKWLIVGWLAFGAVVGVTTKRGGAEAAIGLIISSAIIVAIVVFWQTC
jgi:hypothetical protein